jgi:hypothetical protein
MTVRRAEAGKRISNASIRKLASALGCHPGELLVDDHEEALS